MPSRQSLFFSNWICSYVKAVSLKQKFDFSFSCWKSSSGSQLPAVAYGVKFKLLACHTRSCIIWSCWLCWFLHPSTLLSSPTVVLIFSCLIHVPGVCFSLVLITNSYPTFQPTWASSLLWIFHDNFSSISALFPGTGVPPHYSHSPLSIPVL